MSNGQRHKGCYAFLFRRPSAIVSAIQASTSLSIQPEVLPPTLTGLGNPSSRYIFALHIPVRLMTCGSLRKDSGLCVSGIGGIGAGTLATGFLAGLDFGDRAGVETGETGPAETRTTSGDGIRRTPTSCGVDGSLRCGHPCCYCSWFQCCWYLWYHVQRQASRHAPQDKPVRTKSRVSR